MLLVQFSRDEKDTPEDPTWQVTLRSSVMGFPLRTILGFVLTTIRAVYNNWRCFQTWTNVRWTTEVVHTNVWTPRDHTAVTVILDTDCILTSTTVSVRWAYITVAIRLRYDYDTTMPRRIRLQRKWSKLRYAFDSTAIRQLRLRRKIDMFIFCSRRIASNGRKRVRCVVVGS